MSEAASSDPTAVSAADLFRAHARFVASFAVRLGAAPNEIDDIVQEVFLTAHRRGGFVPGSAQPTTWLAEIAIRVVSTSKRSARRRRADVSTDVVEAAPERGDSRGPFEAAAQNEALGRIQQALDTLPVERRAVFILYEVEGVSGEEIAQSLGVPVGTVYSRLNAARKEVNEAYKRLSRSTAERTAPTMGSTAT